MMLRPIRGILCYSYMEYETTILLLVEALRDMYPLLGLQIQSAPFRMVADRSELERGQGKPDEPWCILGGPGYSLPTS